MPQRSYEDAGLTYEMIYAIAHEMLQDNSSPDPDPDWIAERLGFEVHAEVDEVFDWIADVYPIDRCSQCDFWFECGELDEDDMACPQCLRNMQEDDDAE